MRFKYGDVSVEGNKTNTFLFNYANDMMSGIFVDVDDENYFFIHNGSASYEDAARCAINEGIHQITMPENVDLTEYPHNCVVGSLARFTVQAAEDIAREAAEGV